MSVLAECPSCHKKQSARNRHCVCGENLVQAKRSRRVRYWINYRLPGGKQRRESVGFSIEEARAAEGKRLSQKKENRIFEMLPGSKMTFSELTQWYLNLKSVQKLSSYDRVVIALNNFNQQLGNMVVANVKPLDLEDYQGVRDEQGMSPATIDMEISIAKTMVTKAFDNDMVDGRVIKAFRNVKRLLKKGGNARKRTLTIEEYLKLIQWASPHFRNVLIMDFNTGMRAGEVRTLKWSYIDLENMMIRLPAEATKEGRSKDIPINHHAENVLNRVPRAIQHDFVFTFRGNPIKGAGGFKRAFRTACTKAGIPCGMNTLDGIIFHDIRRTVKTNMLNAGVDKVHRDVILGHSLEGMDVHYLAPSEESLKAAMEKYTTWLDGQLASASVDQNVDQVKNR